MKRNDENQETCAQENQCIHHLLKMHAEKTPDAAAIHAPGRKPLTYRHLYEQILYVTHCLNNSGLGRNDRIAIVLPNGPELATALLAVSACLTSAPLNPDLGIYDNFFARGGDSLLATRVVSRLNAEFRINLPVRIIFKNPKLLEQALLLEKAILTEIEKLTDDEADDLARTPLDNLKKEI